MFVPLLFLALHGYPLRIKRLLLSLITLTQGLQQLPYLTTEFSTYLALTQTVAYKNHIRVAQEVEEVLKHLQESKSSKDALAAMSIVMPNELPIDYAKLGIPTQQVRKLYGNFTKEMVEGYKDPTRNVFFQTPDLIVLTKDLPLFNIEKEEYKKTVTYPDLLASKVFYDQMLSGDIYSYGLERYTYKRVQETPEFVILEKVMQENK